MISGMISRAQKYIFFAMLMAWRGDGGVPDPAAESGAGPAAAAGHARASDIAETTATAPRTVTLYVPNDLDDSLTAVERRIPMPADENAQARVLLERLIEAWRAPDSTHRINAASGVNDVYFLAAPRGRVGRTMRSRWR